MYVGARVCAECHEGHGMGHQYSHWLAVQARRGLRVAGDAGGQGDRPPQRHPRGTAGVADLPRAATPPAPRRRSGRRTRPSTSRTVSSARMCHGPGSEYMDEEVMGDREAAVRAGLKFLSVRECELCHEVKGSHVAVLTVAGSTSTRPGRDRAPDASPEWAGTLPAVAGGPAPADAPRLHRVDGLRPATAGPEMGYQYSQWRLSPHAHAYAVLGHAGAARWRRRWGSTATRSPASPACLKCHATGPRRPAWRRPGVVQR